VHQFLDKKRAEGKPYFVYMTAAQNKFLRIYYARVKECLVAFDAQQHPENQLTLKSTAYMACKISSFAVLVFVPFFTPSKFPCFRA